MSCLSVNITRATDDLSVAVDRIAGGDMSVEMIKASPALNIALSLIPRFNVACSLIGERLKASVSIVCTLSEIKEWLKVSPQEVQWITEDMGAYFDVFSNVEWMVVANEKPKNDFSRDFSIDFAIIPMDFSTDFNKDFAIK